MDNNSIAYGKVLVEKDRSRDFPCDDSYDIDSENDQQGHHEKDLSTQCKKQND